MFCVYQKFIQVDQTFGSFSQGEVEGDACECKFSVWYVFKFSIHNVGYGMKYSIAHVSWCSSMAHMNEEKSK